MMLFHIPDLSLREVDDLYLKMMKISGTKYKLI
jgi:hypothetical protein